MRVITLLLLSYFLVACSSNLSKGNNMMDAEQFDEAVRYYEKAIQDDPGDTEVATKLYEARTRMVMANLIKVRLQRQSNQHRAAALVLNQSLHNIKRWKIIADSGVKAT
ncbi:MAG: tetratricopeptide (TPR) repeat protein, partial [Psychrobacter glaciei]